MDRELLLLGLLRRVGTHGYQLHEFINQNMASCVDLKKPTAYFLLDKMAEAGWITQSEEQEGNRPPRRVYHLTAEGEAVYQRLLRENLSTHHPVRFPGDISLAFLKSLPTEESVELLRQRRALLASDMEAARSAPQHHGAAQLVVEHLVHHLDSELRWLDDLIERIPQLEQE